jgi:DNA (cytosine-5)-methyltransferase 1
VASPSRRLNMLVSYDKLWKLLIDKKMNRTELKEAAGISFNVLAKLGKGETVSMESILKICKALDCDISDVMEVEKEERKNGNSSSNI